MESLRGRKCWRSIYGGLSTDGGRVDSSAHAQVGQLGHERHHVQQHVVGAQVVMNERRILAVEIG